MFISNFVVKVADRFLTWPRPLQECTTHLLRSESFKTLLTGATRVPQKPFSMTSLPAESPWISSTSCFRASDTDSAWQRYRNMVSNVSQPHLDLLLNSFLFIYQITVQTEYKHVLRKRVKRSISQGAICYILDCSIIWFLRLSMCQCTFDLGGDVTVLLLTADTCLGMSWLVGVRLY